MPKKGFKHSEESKALMKKSQTGAKNHFFGKKHSEDSKLRVSESKRGRCGGDKHPMWKGGISPKYRDKLAPRPRPDICEVCGAFVGKGKQGIHYDHDHITGKFRGWLCARYNLTLGWVKDNSELLLNLSNYLKSSRGESVLMEKIYHTKWEPES